MSILSAFSSSVVAMMSQSHALSTIGNNIANMTTGGFKRTETTFSTLVSKTRDHQSDLGGVRPRDYNRIDRQGLLVTGSNDLDVAINGDGFFILNTMLDGSGQTLYSRDGSFELRTGADTTTTADDGSTITVKEGYLVDKNGYYVQGWSSSATTGAFPTSGSTTSLRIDQFAFSDAGIATTTAKLGLNLPANDTPPLAQVDKVTLVGTPEANDTYSITVDGTTVTYTVTGGEANIDAVRDGLVAAITANSTVNSKVTASNGGDGALLLTANTPGGTFTASSTAVNGGATADNSSTSTIVLVAEAATGHQRNIDIFDSNGVRQSVPLGFTKTATNQWQMTTTTSRTTVAQVDTITLAGTVEANDTYRVTVDGTVVTYTVTGAEANIGEIRDNLVAAINGDAVVGTKVTAAASGTTALTLTAASAGTAFTATSSATHGGTSVAQVDTTALTIPGANFPNAQGLGYTLTVGGNSVSYIPPGPVADLATFRNNFVAAINADPAVSAIVTAAPGAAAGEITLTADTAGSAFTSSISANQLDRVDLDGTPDFGDTYSVTINGNPVTYNVTGGEGTINGIATAFAAQINADPTVNSIVTATSVNDVLGLTVKTASQSLTTTAGFADGGAVPDNDATLTTNAQVTAGISGSSSNTTANYTALADNTAALANTTANVTDSVTSSPIALAFNSNGQITTTSPITLPLTFAGGGTATVAFDVSDFTQFAGDFISLNYSKNGNSAADMRSLTFNGVGEIVADFADSTFRAIYKLPLAVFSNPNGMERRNGNTFVETTESGTPRVVSAGNNGFAMFVPGALEKSNVDIADEFARMIMTQNAYNSAATVFKTVDEMTMIARDLKS